MYANLINANLALGVSLI